MKVLVTGATGFIGSHLTKALSEAGHRVRCLVRKTSKTDCLQHLPNVEFFEGDIAEEQTLEGICEGIEVVINSAGILGQWNSTVEQLRPVNADGIVHLAGEIEKHHVSYVVHLSAGGVTGPVRDALADESYDCQPVTPYEKTKREGEQNALRLHYERKLPVAVVRPTFTYGPYDLHKLPLFQAVKEKRLVLVGSGESTNHPVYIDDLVRGILLILEHRPKGEVFIIGGPQPVSKKELIGTIAKELGIQAKFFHLPRWFAIVAAYNMVFVARLLHFEPILTPSRVSMMADNWGYSINKARERLGYVPQVVLAEGIHRTVESYFELGWL